MPKQRFTDIGNIYPLCLMVSNELSPVVTYFIYGAESSKQNEV